MNMTIACALRWGVASVGIFSTGHGSPFMGKHFKCKVYTGRQLSFEAERLKKVDIWLV